MARIRTIKPEFWSSGDVLECEPLTRLLFIGMWNFSDDFGRMPLSLKRLKSQIFPGDEISLAKIREMLIELSHHTLITVYEVENIQYIQVTGWKHQRVSHPTQSTIPAQDALGATVIREDSGNFAKMHTSTLLYSAPPLKKESLPEAAMPMTAHEAAEEAAKAKDFFDPRVKRICDAAGTLKLSIDTRVEPILKLIDEGIFDLELDVLPGIAEAVEKAKKPIKDWEQIIGWIKIAREKRDRAKAARPASNGHVSPPRDNVVPIKGPQGETPEEMKARHEELRRRMMKAQHEQMRADQIEEIKELRKWGNREAADRMEQFLGIKVAEG